MKKFSIILLFILGQLHAMLFTQKDKIPLFDEKNTAVCKPFRSLRDKVVDDFQRRIIYLLNAMSENSLERSAIKRKLDELEGEEYHAARDFFDDLAQRSNLQCEVNDLRSVKTNYKKLQLKHHPDKGGDVDVCAQLIKTYKILVASLSEKDQIQQLKEEEGSREKLQNKYQMVGHNILGHVRLAWPFLAIKSNEEIYGACEKNFALRRALKKKIGVDVDMPHYTGGADPIAFIKNFKTKQLAAALVKMGKMRDFADFFLKKITEFMAECNVTTPTFFSLPYNAIFLIDNEDHQTRELSVEFFEKLYVLMPNLGQIALICKLEELPKSMSLFKDLQALIISHNNLRTLPEWITQLPHLKLLDISDNPLEMTEELQKILSDLEQKNVRVIK